MAALIGRDEAVAKSLLGEENRPPDEKEGPLMCFYSFGNEVAQNVILSSKRPSFTSGAHGSGQPSGVSRWFFFMGRGPVSGSLSLLSGQLCHVETGQFSFKGLVGFYGKGSTNRCGCRFFLMPSPPSSVPCCTVPALALATGIPLHQSWPCGDFLRQLEKRLGTNKRMLSLPCELGSRQTLGETEDNPGQSNSKTLGSSTLT